MLRIMIPNKAQTSSLDQTSVLKLNLKTSFMSPQAVLRFPRIPKEQASLLLRRLGIVVFVESQQS